MRTNLSLEKRSFIVKLINLFIRELINCSLWAIFESRTMPKYVNLIAFLQKLISKEHVAVIMEFPDWIQVKKKYTKEMGELKDRKIYSTGAFSLGLS